MMISIVIPIYNQEKYLRQSLDSIKNQTFTDLEVILIDDGSTDGSLAICQEYEKTDKRFKAYSYENGGLSVARNRGIDLVTSPFITFLDPDDWLEEKAIEVLYNSLQNHQADISCCGYYLASEEEIKSVWDSDKDIIWSREEALQTLFIGKEMKDFAWGKLYKTKLFDGVRFPKGWYFEDISTTYKTFNKAKKIVKIEKPLLYYRQHDASINSSNTKTPKKALDYYFSLVDTYDFVKNNPDSVVDKGRVKAELQRRMYRSQKQLIKWYSIYSDEYKTYRSKSENHYKNLLKEVNVSEFGFLKFINANIVMYLPFITSFIMKLKGKKKTI